MLTVGFTHGYVLPPHPWLNRNNDHSRTAFREKPIDAWQKKQRDQYPIAEPMKKSTELVDIPMNIGTTPSTEIEMCFVHLLGRAARPHVSPR